MFCFPKLNTCIRIGLIAGCALAQPTQGDTSGLTNDPIAAHFNRVFGEPKSSQSKSASGWAPESGTGESVWEIESILSFSGTWIAPTEVRGYPGSDVQTSFGQLTYGINIPLRPGKTLGIVSTASQYHISEDGPVTSHVFPFSELWQWDAGIVYTQNINPRLDLFGGISGIISGGNSDIIKDGAKGLGYIGGVFRITPNLTVAAGIALSPDTTSGQRSVPLLLVDWRINDKFRLSARNGVSFEYAHNGNWKHVVGAGIDGYGWMVDLKGSIMPEDPGKDYSLLAANSSANVFYRHTFDNKLEVTAKVLLCNWNEISIYRDNDEIHLDEFKTSTGFTLSAGFRF